VSLLKKFARGNPVNQRPAGLNIRSFESVLWGDVMKHGIRRVKTGVVTVKSLDYQTLRWQLCSIDSAKQLSFHVISRTFHGQFPFQR
jgi:hypothetical protein